MSFSHVVLLRLLLQLRLKMVLMTEQLWATDPDNESKSICSKFHHIDTTTTQLNSKQSRQNSGNIENFEKKMTNHLQLNWKLFISGLCRVHGLSWIHPKVSSCRHQSILDCKLQFCLVLFLHSAPPPLHSPKLVDGDQILRNNWSSQEIKHDIEIKPSDNCKQFSIIPT